MKPVYPLELVETLQDFITAMNKHEKLQKNDDLWAVFTHAVSILGHIRDASLMEACENERSQ